MEPAHVASVAPAADGIDDAASGCSYCAPGTICSAVGMVEFFEANSFAQVTRDLEAMLEGHDVAGSSDARARNASVLFDALLGF
jgi:hypothetical protein